MNIILWIGEFSECTMSEMPHREMSDAFANVLRKKRTAKNLSRNALATKAGLHQTYVGMIERGLSNPSLDAANALAEALDIPLSKLIREAESCRSVPPRIRPD